MYPWQQLYVPLPLLSLFSAKKLVSVIPLANNAEEMARWEGAWSCRRMGGHQASPLGSPPGTR